MKGNSVKRRPGRPDAATAAGIEKALLDVARRHFTRKGFANTSLDDIASSLRSSKHTIYRRFADKESLFEAVVNRDLRIFCDKMIAVLGDEPDMENLKSCAKIYFDFAKDGGYASLYLHMQAEATVSESMRRRLQRLQKAALGPIKTALAYIESHGSLQFEQVGDPCGVLISLIDGAADHARGVGSLGIRKENLLFSERWNIFVRLFATTTRKK